MSLKSLFGKDKKNLKISSLVNSDKLLEDVESISYIDQFIKDRKRFRSHTDYYTGSNFAVYGSLHEYYRAGIDRIINTYPYDGSLKERLEWINDSNGFDLHLFENEYPRTNGYITFADSAADNTDSWGSVTSTSGAYGNPANKEYILIKGGPNVGNYYNTGSLRTSNLEINGRNGNTVEFWLKKSNYVTSKTQREVLFDISTTGSHQGSSAYGRLTIELDSGNSNASPFLLTYQSGSTGYKEVRVGAPQLYTSASDGNWHHYAISFKNESNKIRTSLYIDGELHKSVLTGSAIGSLNTALIGTIGALSTGKDPQLVTRTSSESFIPGLGYGKLSGSLDEFRFWKKERTAKDVGRFWFTQVGAGTNTDIANTPLGFYYKFNEGETGQVRIDKTVLDYSGRVSNGQWVGYTGYGRTNNSAMVESSASVSEFKDPIIYHDHPKVKNFRESALEQGYAYDLTNASSMYYSFPDWIVDEDGESSEDLKKMTQIVASYFDSLFLQIRDLKKLRHIQYSGFKNKPHPFNQIKLQSMGLVSPELFMDANILNTFVNRDEDQNYEQNLSDIKNFIYNNIYGNLESIFKSKGTIKSFRNLFRCFGVDNELIKINMYSTDSTYPVENSYQNSVVKSKYLNFNSIKNKNATVFQSLDGLRGSYRLADARGYVTGSEGLISDDAATAIGMTAEVQVFIPKLYQINHPFYFDSEVSSSLFGCHSVKKNADGKNEVTISWPSSADDHSNFQVYVVKENAFSKTAKFVLESRNGIFDPVESDFIVDLYDSNRWNLAARLVAAAPEGDTVSGSGNNYKFELYGVNVIADSINDKFSLSSTISSANAANFIKNSRRFYVGAHRTNYTGGVITTSDVKITNFRVWNKSLTDDEINSHAFDPRSYGLSSPSKKSFPLSDIGGAQIPQIDLLAINWDFSDLTGSDSSGQMWINDVSSGSHAPSKLHHGKIHPIVGRIHPGKGLFFPSSTTSSVDVEFDQATRLQPFENVKASDMVQIVSNDDITFTRETKPTDYFYSFEKSMYAAISDEMINFFAGVSEFSTLIGAPVERYRQNYKGLAKLRQVFFRRIQNAPDIERYTEYYKWLDSSLSIMIDQLIPASVDSSEDIRNMIESHILERSKYFNKFPTMEFKQSDPEGQIRGVNELLYDWQHGHAPLGTQTDDNVNCLWTKERAQRSTDILVSGSTETDPDREIVRRVINTSVSGSTYATRRLSRPYRLSVEDQRHAKGGDNTFGNKKKRFYTGVSTAHGTSHISVTGSDAAPLMCKDTINPSKKKKIRATADVAFSQKDRDINDVAPFTLYSSSLDDVRDYHTQVFSGFKKGVEISNLHADEYGDDREVTLQSPFTEKWVGGNAHRRQDLSGSLLGQIDAKKQGHDRVEAFKLLAEGGILYILPPNASGIDASKIPIIDHTLQTAQVLRDGLAKRPVNIKNIATTTGSIALGNYNHIYDVVQYTTEDQRKDFVVDNLEQMTSSNSTAIPGVKEFSKFPRPARKSVFKARFSAPGGTEVAGDSRGGHSIDRETNQYSVYNSLNYRNLSVRGPRDYLNSVPQTGSTDSNSLVTDHKINSNPRYRRKMDGGMYSGEFDRNMDNRFVQHEIPQNDYQYAWFTSSISEHVDAAAISGHLHSFSQASIGDATGSLRYERTYEFVSGNFGRFGRQLPMRGQDLYDLNFANINIPGVNVQDHLTSSINTISSAHAHGMISGTINYRHGPYGWPTWKQIRVGETALARYFRRNNIYSLPVRDHGGGLEPTIDFRTLGNYSWPDNIDHRVGGSDRKIDHQNYRFTDPPVTSNRHPMALRTFYPNVPYIGFGESNTPPSEDRIPRLPRYGIPPTQNRRSFDRVPEATPGNRFNALSSFQPASKKYSFSNKLTQFADDELSKVLNIRQSLPFKEDALLQDDLLTYDFTVPGSTVEYSMNIFPKEKNTFLEQSRERTRFKTDDFWKTTQAERVLTNITNSQGNTIPELSVWPLDGPTNFGSNAINTTVQKLTGDGSGELFANYAVFHNGMTHPSASALYARPFPMQSTSSLPATSRLFKFYLAHTISRKAQIHGDFTADARKTLASLGQTGVILKVAKANSNQTPAPVQVSGAVPDGYVNDAGVSSTTSDTKGVRCGNAQGNAGFQPITFQGTRTAAASITGEPGGYSFYRFLRTTGSVINSRDLLINFHLRTGGNGSNADHYGIKASTLPMYVQIGSDGNGWLTVGKIDPEDKHKVNNRFAFHSLLVTASSPNNREVRFIAPCTNSPDTGNWNLALPTIYEALPPRILPFKLSVESGNDFVGVDDSRPPSSSYTVANRFPAKRHYFTPQSNIGFLSFAAIDEYGDETFRNWAGAGVPDTLSAYFSSSISLEVNKTFNIKFRQDFDSGSVMVYPKNNEVTNHLYGSQFFRTPEHAARSPFNYDNYEDFAYQSKLLAKDFSVVPEFRISEHMNRYINEIGGADPFFSCNDTMLTLTGSKTLQNSSQDGFYEVYSHTDFIKHFDVVESRMNAIKGATPTKLSLECKAFKKFLPYKGFYPADRMTQMASEFSSSYSQFVTGGHWRNVLTPYYAPGIGFNTIKSGIAVDYPIFEPYEDRIYNQYGIIFQSASLAIDHDGGNAVSADTGRPWIAGEGGSGLSGSAKLSLNRIEIGGGSDWAKLITGSLSPSAVNKKLAFSCWVYLPKKHRVADQYGHTVNSYGLMRQRGTLASFGSGQDTTDSAWKKGIHFGYWTQASIASTSNEMGSDLSSGAATDDVDPNYTMGFTCFGGDGKDFFAQALTAGGLDPQNPNKSISPGWNHILLTLDPNGLGYDEDYAFIGFDAYVNGERWTTDHHLTASSGFYDGGFTAPEEQEEANYIVTNSGSAQPLLDGDRNCFIGTHLGSTKRINALPQLNLRPSTYEKESSKIFLLTTTTSTATELRAKDNSIASEHEHTMLDWLQPSEMMISEVMVFNAVAASSTEEMAKRLSGYVNGAPNFKSFTNNANLEDVDNLTVFGTVGNTLGPRHPYTCLEKQYHKNLIAWYRPGNDTGYVPTGRTNGLHVFNHAQNLFSGKIPGDTTGSILQYDIHSMPSKYNHLSGTLYGFTNWTGSVARDLKFSPRYRQRWNGIADLSNPAQYTYVYSFPSASIADNPNAPFKTWYANIGSDYWFENSRAYTEKLLIENNPSLTGSYMVCTGSVRIPSFIVGTNRNFTEDSSVPRIGSASYGTYHFTGSSAVGAEEVYSQGWINDYQKNTGVRKVNRIPFEAIIFPAAFTPESKDDGDSPFALYYDNEPHYSASLLGAMTNKRRYVQQNSHNQQVYEWTDKDTSVDYKTDENFHFGVAMNSASVMSQFDLASARRRSALYTYAANNFYAECLNFFIANRKGITIRSKSRPGLPVDPNMQQYRMTIELNSGRNPVRNKDNPLYNNPAAFGPPVDAGIHRRQHIDGTHFSRSLQSHGYGFAPYLPSHYDGFSRAVYTFTPDSNIVYTTVPQILEDTTVEYFRSINSTGSISTRGGSGFASNERPAADTVVSSYNRRFAMHITESFNGLSLGQEENLVQRYTPAGDPIEGEKSLVIQTKFECPTFDFSEVDADQPRTSETVQHLPRIKGIWHQTGSFGADAKRPNVRIITPRATTNVGDLSRLLGMQIEEDQNVVGELPESRTVREGVVAIPFRTRNNVRRFYNLPHHEVYQAVRNLGYSDYKLKTEEERRQFEEFANRIDNPPGLAGGGGIPGLDITRRILDDQSSVPLVRPSIQKMVRSMMHYNIPPQFNFLKYNDPNGKYIKPFAMYIFDFSVSLNKEDIARIWQNVTPDFGLNDFGSTNGSRQILSSRVVEHDLYDADDLLNPIPDMYPLPGEDDRYGVRNWTGGFHEDLQWMVFKVKQKAESNYFRKKELDKLPDGHPEKIISVENDIFRYGFNWPYDYFSLVELVNLKSSVSFGDKEHRFDGRTARTFLNRREDD